MGEFLAWDYILKAIFSFESVLAHSLEISNSVLFSVVEQSIGRAACLCSTRTFQGFECSIHTLVLTL